MIYLDYSANTPVDERVLAQFCAVERRCPGNANSADFGQFPTDSVD